MTVARPHERRSAAQGPSVVPVTAASSRNNSQGHRIRGVLRRHIVPICVSLGLCLAAGALSAQAPRPPNDAHKPHRIVSINLCADDVILRLAQRQNVASVTWLSRDREVSNVVDLADQIPINHGLAEEVMAFQPDLVVAGRYTARPTVSILNRIGIPTLDLDVPVSFDEVRAQYREVAARIGEPESGERMVAELDRALAKVTTEPPAKPPRALVLEPNGYAVSRGSIIDELITRAGLENLAVTLGLAHFEQIPLEVVIANPIDVLIVSSRRDDSSSLATELLQHPVLSKLSDRTRRVIIPNRLWTCAGPNMAEVIDRLRRAATTAVN
jgi:iron complex transport system substrate-binding protein